MQHSRFIYHLFSEWDREKYKDSYRLGLGCTRFNPKMCRKLYGNLSHNRTQRYLIYELINAFGPVSTRLLYRGKYLRNTHSINNAIKLVKCRSSDYIRPGWISSLSKLTFFSYMYKRKEKNPNFVF